MNANQALTKAQKLWGKTGAVSDKGKRFASNPEKREAARLARATLRGFIVTREDRRYFRDLMDSLFSQSVRERYSVGKVEMGLFFSVHGTGDTWEEAFAAAAERDARWRKAA